MSVVARQVLPARDPGPMARLADVISDAGAPAEVFRLLTDEEPKTLEEIAKAWGVPKGKFCEWFSTEHKETLDAAERVLGIEVCHAVKKMTDDATQANFALVKFKTDRYLRLAGLLNAERYSPRIEHKHSGVLPVLVIEIAGQAQERLVGSGVAPERVPDAIGADTAISALPPARAAVDALPAGWI